MKKDLKFATKAIHAGQAPDPTTGAVITPIYQTTTFVQESPGNYKGYDYSRSGNPTRTALEVALAALESGTRGFAFASGLGALTTLALAVMQAGDHVIVGDDVYGGTFRLFDKVMKRFGLAIDHVDMTIAANIERAITPSTRMIILESPTNPMLKLADLSAAAEIGRRRGILTCVDNTFASPALQRPLEHGIDIVLHSTTKYIGGHSDVVGGALVVGRYDLADKIRFHQNAIGATPDPFASWLTLRGLKTLALRMRQHSESALELARFLEAHDKVARVIYPGLPNHPQHELAMRQMSAPGGMISLLLKGGKDEAAAFLKGLRLFHLAESLGGVESLVEVPALMTHASLTPEGRQALGISDSLIRLSVGIEDVDDLRDDLAAGLAAVRAAV